MTEVICAATGAFVGEYVKEVVLPMGVDRLEIAMEKLGVAVVDAVDYYDTSLTLYECLYGGIELFVVNYSTTSMRDILCLHSIDLRAAPMLDEDLYDSDATGVWVYAGDKWSLMCGETCPRKSVTIFPFDLRTDVAKLFA
jgi:hypothetical protein